MTVLNDSKISEYISQNIIKVSPPPFEIQYQPASLDLRLDNIYCRHNKEMSECIDTRDGTSVYSDYETFSNENPLKLEPNDFILCQTLEYIGLPNDLLGRVEGRSSIGRLGVAIHITAGFIDPGFEGNITLEIINFSNVPVLLYPNQRICQIVFEELNAPCEKPYGSNGRNKYQGQRSPTPSRVYNDKEYK